MEESNFQKFKQMASGIFTQGVLKIRSYYTYIMIAFFVIIFLLMGMGTVDSLKLICSNQKSPVVTDNKSYEANYKSDMNFLECIGEQHNCLYKNLSNGIESIKILEKCKDENYCNKNSRSIHVRIPK
jgi:hypothetical protein